MAKLTIGKKGIKLIQSFEGYRNKAYFCPAGLVTIGYGTTRINGKPVSIGMKCTKKQALEWMKEDLEEFEDAVNDLVDVKITQNQFDAIVSFAYNCGIGNLKSSTLLKKVNSKDFKGAADEFLKWNKGNGKVLNGLTRRRKSERKLFLSK
jgi:lysozyme